MKIIYEAEHETAGIAVVQFEPQARTIFRGYAPKRLNLPYVIQIVRYELYHLRDGSSGWKTKYVYRGLPGMGLSVFFANAPLNGGKSLIYNTPFDYGVVCTPHKFDNKKFKSKEELISFVTSIWWQLTHDGDPLYGWPDAENVLKHKWGNQRRSLKLKDAFSMLLPLDKELQDKINATTNCH